MSREALVSKAIEAVNERDIDRYLGCCTDDIELRTPTSEVAGAYVGAEGIRRFFADVEDAGSSFHLDVERLEPVGARVVALVQTHVSGRLSGISMDLEAANLYEFEGDRIRRVRIFPDRRQGLDTALVAAAVDALNERDADTVVALFAPDAEVDWSRSRGPLSGVYRGHAGLRELLEEFWDIFEEIHVEPDDFIVAGPHVVVPNSGRMRGRAGVEVVARSAWVYTVADGRIARLRMFENLDDARAALA